MRSTTENDPKLRDSGVRRGSCVVGGKAVAEAATVTHGAVLCSAWLGLEAFILDIDWIVLGVKRVKGDKQAVNELGDRLQWARFVDEGRV